MDLRSAGLAGRLRERLDAKSGLQNVREAL